MAELAKGKLRKKLPALKAALEGRFSSHHALLAGHILAHIDHLEETIAQLTAEIETRIAPFAQKADGSCVSASVLDITFNVAAGLLLRRSSTGPPTCSSPRSCCT